MINDAKTENWKSKMLLQVHWLFDARNSELEKVAMIKYEMENAFKPDAYL
jgi:DNA polymerase I-like protein with 3'-5' exonuclease and polymerase domains